jgi:flagellar FliL protein
MADVNANQGLQAGTSSPGQNKSSTPKIVLGMLLLFGVGFGAWWTFGRTSPVNSAEQAGSTLSALPLESFTVNLADQEDGRFLRLTLSLGVNGRLPAVQKSEVNSADASGVSIATIRDSIITVLAQCTSDQLLSSEGKLKLKLKLIQALNHDVPALGVQEIYFTEFLVQR